MGVSDLAIVEMADALWRAEHERAPIAPPTDAHPDLGSPTATRSRPHNVARRTSAGRQRARPQARAHLARTQQLLGVDEPTFGVLFDDMFVEDGAELRWPSWSRRGWRPSWRSCWPPTWRARASPPPTCSPRSAGVLPAHRGSRQPDRPVAEPDRRHRGRQRVARPGWSSAAGRPPSQGLDLRLLGVLFSRNGMPIDSGAGAAALGHPAAALGWLANTLSGFGAGLRRGDVVLAGACTAWCPARPGDASPAEFAHLGAVSVRFGGGQRMTDPAPWPRRCSPPSATAPRSARSPERSRSSTPPSATRRRTAGRASGGWRSAWSASSWA